MSSRRRTPQQRQNAQESEKRRRETQPSAGDQAEALRAEDLPEGADPVTGLLPLEAEAYHVFLPAYEKVKAMPPGAKERWRFVMSTIPTEFVQRLLWTPEVGSARTEAQDGAMAIAGMAAAEAFLGRGPTRAESVRAHECVLTSLLAELALRDGYVDSVEYPDSPFDGSDTIGFAPRERATFTLDALADRYGSGKRP